MRRAKKQKNRISRSHSGSADGNFEFDVAPPGFAGSPGSPGSPGSHSKSMTKIKKHVVRSHFPETWLFQLKPVDRRGKAVVSLKAPDTLTSWTGEAVCMSSKAGIGLAQPASILVKKVTVIMHCRCICKLISIMFPSS